ncbi:hypothetical protein CHH49_10880 [Terribacillus saccharophilus]|uniref:DarT1-associated NADAR antitoxin family protein n=1 Tax=Terribacillus saccharophilus TaxID=361277 RepID=UPI000BA5995C|nr:hypothetical protein [Terribacillus saccharophilus]PAF21396.1 hypothetical protein CHH49_10880 [Terribacillus saccharophilus]
MANRPVFISKMNSKTFLERKIIEFEWYPGFSIVQKQKSISSFHKNIKVADPSLKILEISSKSNIDLGISLSAFNLMITGKNQKTFSVETAFQASKVFEKGGPFLDLYNKTSREAKKDLRLKNSGSLKYFQYFNRKFDLEPKTFFYDWLYINALHLNEHLRKEIVKYNAFTDIEFNPQKSINCQARAAALYVSLVNLNLIDIALSSIDNYRNIVIGESKKELDTSQQLSFLDD